jgi:IclR family acetate operon transcriptional repressor
MNKTSNLTIQSVDRAMAILDVLATTGEQGLPLKEISTQLGINSSTVHHLLATLMQRNVVEQDPVSQFYRLGLHLIELGNAALASTSLTRIAKDYVERLADATAQSASLMLFHGSQRTIIIRAPRRQHLLSAQSVPLDRSTLHASGSGKLLLAHLPPDRLQEYLDHTRLEGYSENTITDRAALLDELERIRTKGIAEDRAEYSFGVRCMSVPVKDASRRVIGCFDLVFPNIGLIEERLQEWATTAQQIAAELSDQLQKIELKVD